jgi:two-component system KDP operon response regulator KdpE
LAELADYQPALVILDLGLPDMDGQTVLARLQIDYRDLPVLVYSGDSDALTALERETNEKLAVLSKRAGVESFTKLVPTLLFKRRNSDKADGVDAIGRPSRTERMA